MQGISHIGGVWLQGRRWRVGAGWEERYGEAPVALPALAGRLR